MTIAAPTLGQRASLWVSAGVVIHTFWTSAAPAMTYPLYAQEWGLTPTVITAIFAIYPIVVVVALICFGEISDYAGRRATILFGLGASLLGVFCFGVAPGVFWLFVGRVLMGLGVGLSAGPSTAAMVEFSPPGQSERAGSITTAAQAAGYVMAFLLGGALIQYAPLPSTAGVGYSLLFLGGLEIINLAAPPERRGGILSALYLFAYLSLGGVALTLGKVATVWGLKLAIDLGAATITLLSGVTIALVASMRSPQKPAIA